MSTTPTTTESPLVVDIVKDRMRADIRLRKDVGPDSVDRAHVLAALEAAKVPVTEEVAARIDAYLEHLSTGDGVNNPLTVAEGKPVVEGKDGLLAWSEDFVKTAQEWNEDDQIDYYSTSAISVVEQDAAIGQIVPPAPGVPGRDVLGNEVRPQKQVRAVEVGENVALHEDGRTAVAAVAGKVVYRNLKVSVSEVLDIAGNVDFSVGNIDVPSDVSVRGTVQDLFSVKTKKSLTVGGAIEGAEVEAGGDVIVRGGILSREKGSVWAGGEVVAKFCDEAKVTAKGDVKIAKECVNSRIHTDGRLLIEHGAVIGGEVSAAHGVEAKILGSDAGVPTSIGVGAPKELLQEAKKAEAEKAERQRAVAKIRETVAPLLAHAKRLTAEQKERATELMFQADTIEMEITSSQDALGQKFACYQKGEPNEEGETQDAAYVLVTGRACQGVSVRISDRIATFQQETKGPAKICKRKIKNHTVIALVNQLTGSVIPLNSRALEFDDKPAD